MDLQNRKNAGNQGIVGPVKNEKVNPFTLTRRQHLIHRFNDLLYRTQRNKVTDEQVEEILKILSHI